MSKTPEIGKITTVRIASQISVQGNYAGRDAQGLHKVEVDGTIHRGTLLAEPEENPSPM
jgi:hypothetical protein